MKLCRISQKLIQEVLGMYVRQEAAGNPRPRQEDHAQHAPDKSKQNARKQTTNNKQTNQINIPMFLWLYASSRVHLGPREKWSRSVWESLFQPIVSKTHQTQKGYNK